MWKLIQCPAVGVRVLIEAVFGGEGRAAGVVAGSSRRHLGRMVVEAVAGPGSAHRGWGTGHVCCYRHDEP